MAFKLAKSFLRGILPINAITKMNNADMSKPANVLETKVNAIIKIVPNIFVRGSRECIKLFIG